ncbi:MAG: hypothetical protein IPK58_22310 [Acidobacteria bacterium]|nr:hypothetical protein [Acidobacteriota bacterium]
MASAFTLFGELKADTGAFKNSLRDAEARLKATQTNLTQTEQRARSLGITTATSARGFDKLSEQLNKARRSLLETSQAFNRGEASAKQMSSAVKQYDNAMDRVNGRLKDHNAKLTDTQSRLGAARSAFSGLTTSIFAVTAAIGSAVAVGAGLFRLIDSVAEVGDKLKETSDKTNISVRTLSALKIAADQAGSSLDQIGNTLIKFEKLAGQAAQGNEKAIETLAKYGVGPQEAMNDLEGTLGKVFEKIAAMPEGLAQTTAALDLFGKSGADMLPVIKQFDGNLAGLIAKGDKMGALFTKEQSEAADRYKDAMSDLQKTLQGVGYSIGNQVIPSLTTLIEQLSANVAENKGGIAKAVTQLADASTGAIDILGRLGSAVGDLAVKFGLLDEKTAKLLHTWELLQNGTLFGWLAKYGESVRSAETAQKNYTESLQDTQKIADVFTLDPVVKMLQEVDSKFGVWSRGTTTYGVQGVTNFSKGITATQGVVVQAGSILGNAFGLGNIAAILAKRAEIQQAAKQATDVSALAPAASTQGKNVGSAIGSGVLLGLANWASRIVNQARILVSDAIAGMKAEADSKSPSKETMKLGADMGDGLVIGLGSKLGAAVAKSKEFIDGMLGALASKIREVTAAAPTMGDLFKLFDDPKYAKGLATLAKEMGYTVDQLKEFLKIAQQRDEFTALFDTMDRAMRGAGRGGGSERGTGEGDGLTLPGNGADEFANLLVIVPQATAAWTNFFDTFAARIAEMRDSLSNTNELIGETFIDSLSQIGDVFANAVTQWDGTAQGFFRSLAQGFAQMAKQIIADLIRIAVMQAVLKIAGLVGGGLSQSAPGWTSGSSASVIPGVGAGGATAGARVFAEGGYTGSGAKHEPAGIVHRGEFVMPMESVKHWGLGLMESLRNMQMPGAMAYAGASGMTTNNNSNKTNNFNFTMGGGGQVDSRTRSQIVSEVIAAIRMGERRNK